jgi:hypothetical protein
MSDMDPCELCGTQAEPVPMGGYDGIRQRCQRCGDFKLTGTGMAIVRRVPPGDKVKLSGWVRDQNALGEVPELASDRISLVATSPLPGIVERAERLLTHVIKCQSRLGERFRMETPQLSAGVHIQITPRGYMRYEALQTQRSASAQGFVAMWFHDEMREAYARGFEGGIRQAGYDPLRVDGVEHVGKIDDEIAQIRRSRFVVADFTGHRAGVYFEAGFALGLNMPVIWSCRRDDLFQPPLRYTAIQLH